MYRRSLIAALLVILLSSGELDHSAAAPNDEYRLEISFDVPQSKLSGTARIPTAGRKALRLGIGDLTVVSVRHGGKPWKHSVSGGTLIVPTTPPGTLEIAYEGTFAPAPVPANSRDVDLRNVIREGGIFLADGWYPRLAGLARYRLSASLPAGYVPVSEAERIERSDRPGGARFTFIFEHPVDQISLVASDRYAPVHERFRGIDLVACFFSEDRALGEKYLERAKRYIELYETLLVPFPFKRFAIVENFLPTGYAMPTYTLLGQEVVRLPFIVETSLGHEILHQWFGNLAYIDYDKGNWAEGLTTYLADHWYQEQKDEGWRYRKQLLADYTAYVGAKSEIPLAAFSRRFDSASRAVGYGKAAMVFHMVRRELGDGLFFGGLRRFLNDNRFERASWADLQRAFERESGRDLQGFFHAWLHQTGLAEVDIAATEVHRADSNFVLFLELRQKGAVYSLNVPVRITQKSGDDKRLVIPLSEKQKRVRVELAHEPTEVIVDENFDIARRLTPPELPPVIGALFGADARVLVVPSGDPTTYRPLLDRFRAAGAEIKQAESVTSADRRSAALIVLGSENPVLAALPDKPEMPQDGFNISVRKSPWNPTGPLAIVTSGSAAETSAAVSKLRHYGKYSSLRFENGRNLAAVVEPSERGIRRAVAAEEPTVVDLKTLQTVAAMVEGLAERRIVYVGESHDNYAHHGVQLEVLRRLHLADPKLAIGMEMFQRPFQKALDEYISGAIDERTFLKRSEYFKRWDMEYHLYKPILDFARAERIPVVALNIPRDIVEKVARSGIESLSAEDKRDIPQELDLSDEAYRARLKRVFNRHQGAARKNFDFFHQAQVLWDESMAESVDRFLAERPGYRMVVFAGNGHLEYGAGIPSRVFRRNGLPYAVVLNDTDVHAGIADFVVFPQPLSRPGAPKLMVSVEERNKQVRISGFGKNSVAERAGLKIEDVIVSLDGDRVESVADIKVALVAKRPGETVKVAALRADPAGGEQRLQFDVTLE